MLQTNVDTEHDNDIRSFYNTWGGSFINKYIRRKHILVLKCILKRK